MKKKSFGKTNFSVTPLCIGTSALGNFPAQYGYEVNDDRAAATLKKVFESSINFLDTSNEYGNGDSERRIGKALKEVGGLPKGFVLATKVDPIPGTNDFSGARVLKSVEESRERLGIDRFQIMFLHDPEKMTFEEGTKSGGALEVLIKLRDEGLIEYIGLAGGPNELMMKYIQTGALDVVLSHNRFTLLDQSATPVMDEVAARNLAFVNAAPYGGGILVKGPKAVPKYCYSPASARTLWRASQILAACDSFQVPLAAAALQFSMRDPRVHSTVVGITEPERVDQTIRLAEWPIPEALWSQIEPFVAEGRDGIL